MPVGVPVQTAEDTHISHHPKNQVPGGCRAPESEARSRLWWLDRRGGAPDAKAAPGARVGREDERDCAGEGLVVSGEDLLISSKVHWSDELGAVKDERGSAPRVAPPGGQDLGARTFLHG